MRSTPFLRSPMLLLSAAPLLVSLTAAAAGTAATDGAADVKDDLRHARRLSAAFREVARQLAPSVVCINTVDHPPYAPGPQGEMPYPQTPWGYRGQLPDRFGKGSGVVLSPDGYVLTNGHVVNGADEVRVRFADKTELPASLVGVDRDTDLAILKVEASNLVAARFADTDGIEVGDWVLALGNPFGLEQTVTAGIISAKGRQEMGLATFENFLQTDAAINPGNSGGPLVDLDGNVVGINTAISSRDGGSNGIGFAIPASMAKEVAHGLIENGKVSRGWLGVNVQALTPELAENFGVTGPGVIIAGVVPGTPAAKAGLRAGDVIVRIDDQPMETGSQFLRLIGERAPESSITLSLVREGKPLAATAVLGERPGPWTTPTPVARADAAPAGPLGLTLQALDSETATKLGLNDLDGVVVQAVVPGSPGDAAGLRAGDVIRQYGPAPIRTPEDFSAAVAATKGRRPVRILVEREGSTAFMLVRPGAR